MSKRRTKEQKILTTLRKLQEKQLNPSPSQPSSVITTVTTREAKFVPALYFDKGGDYSYMRKDLLKIMLLATLAIGIQIMLSLFINNNYFGILNKNLKLPF